MNDGLAVRKVQDQLNGMKSEALGSMLSQANELRKSAESEFDRRVGEVLYKQVLMALACTRRERCAYKPHDMDCPNFVESRIIETNTGKEFYCCGEHRPQYEDLNRRYGYEYFTIVSGKLN